MSGGFCTMCGFKVPSFDGLESCPNCGDAGIPCGNENQVSVSVNWHELHILCVWAEHHANTIGKRGCIASIAARLHAQHPERGHLTLAGELQDLKDHPPAGIGGIETNVPGVE